jgi:hypothetical protein
VGVDCGVRIADWSEMSLLWYDLFVFARPEGIGEVGGSIERL